MEYIVSKASRERMEKLLAVPEVQMALRFLEEDQENSIREQIELTLLEAPTYHEEMRARRVMEKFKQFGLSNVEMDGQYDVTGLLPGASDDRILVEGHIDTVFGFGTVKEVRREDGVLYAPGIYDNARGVSCILAVLRAIQACNIRPAKSILFAGTTREETPGGLQGMRDMLDRYPDVKASISVDGGFLNGITYNATWSKTVEFTFHGIGGHAGNAFGLCANPLGAACRAVAKLNELQVPDTPKTTYAATTLHTPEGSSAGSIPGSCTLCVNYRSEDRDLFEALEQDIDRCIQEGCREETERWGVDEITVTRRELASIPGGRQDIHSPLVEAHWLAARELGEKTFFRSGGNCNANIAISRDIPAICVGASPGGMNPHSLKERFPEQNAYRCPQGLLLVLLTAAGIDGVVGSCFG